MMNACTETDRATEAPASVASGGWFAWTSEKPKEPGFYWMRWKSKHDHQRPPRVVEIRSHYGNKKLIFLFGVKPMLVEEMDAEWAGPIGRPNDAANTDSAK